MASAATPAIAALVAAGVPHEVLRYHHDPRAESFGDEAAEAVTAAVDAPGLPSEISALGLYCDGDALVRHMMHDKKMDGGKLPFLLARGIGQTYLDKAVDLKAVEAFLDAERVTA